MSVLSSVLTPVLQPVLGSVLDASAGGPPRFRGLDLDFAQGRYALNGPYQPTFPTGWSFSRTGASTAQRVDGALVPFSSGVPRITDSGLLVEEQRTNKVVSRNANPTDTSGFSGAARELVDDTTALSLSGLNSVCTSGKVIMVNNNTASPVSINWIGSTGNANIHTLSCYVRGQGTVRLRTGFTDPVGPSVSLTNAYQRMVRSQGPGMAGSPNSADNMRLDISANSTVYVILGQLEEGAFATSPIVTEGAAATRGADSASITVTSGVSSFTAYYGLGQTASGAVTPGQVFDISASSRPWFNGYLQRLVMQ